jgi:hypothetical protein
MPFLQVLLSFAFLAFNLKDDNNVVKDLNLSKSNYANNVRLNNIDHLKFLGIGRAPDEPEKLFSNTSQKGFLCRQQGKGPVTQTETHLVKQIIIN